MRTRRFLSVLHWPDGWTREQVALHLAEHSGLDQRLLHLKLAAAPPTIIGAVESTAGLAAVSALVEAGGDAMAPTFEDLERLGPTRAIKDLEILDGRIVLRMWRGPGEIINRHDVQILVRGQVRRTTKDISATPPPEVTGTGLMHRRYTVPGHALALGLAAGMAAAYAANAAIEEAQATSFKRLDTSDKLDIHTRDRRVFQINGDKFGYRILGKLRGHGDRANMDAMCELLSHVAPDEIVDPYFELWRPPAGHDKLRLPGRHVNQEDMAFAFYSRWVATMYRHLLGEDGP